MRFVPAEKSPSDPAGEPPGVPAPSGASNASSVAARQAVNVSTRLRGALAAGCGLALLAFLVPVAEAALPGRNGRIAFSDDESDNYGENFGVSTVTARGRGLRSLAGDAERPAYSPDGRLVAYANRSSYPDLARPGIWIVRDAFRGRRRRLTGGQDSEPAWSPSGKRLAFARAVACPLNCRREIWIYDRGRTSRLTEGDSPTWSSRGEIAFARPDGIYAIRPDGSGLRRIVSRGDQPDWSPDGRRIAFLAVRRRDGLGYPYGSVWTVRANGSRLRRLTRQRSDNSPSFSPDGRKIVFIRYDQDADASELTVMSSNGERPKSIFDEINQGTGTDWQPLRRRRR